MRSFSSLLVFETAFDNMVSDDPVLNNMQQQVFEPEYDIVEYACDTNLGEVIDVNFEAEGRVELATGDRLNHYRIRELLEQGVYLVRTRTLSTCISNGGVCAACYSASRPKENVPQVGDRVTVLPLFDKGSEVIGPIDVGSTYDLSLGPSSYDSVLVFVDGGIAAEDSYTISDKKLTVVYNPSPPSEGGGPRHPYLVIRYQSLTRVPYMLWLANTYSGSLLGIKPLPGPLLSVRSLLLSESLKDSPIDTLLADTKLIQAIPANMLEYAAGTQDVLERSLFLIALRAIYDSVNS